MVDTAAIRAVRMSARGREPNAAPKKTVAVITAEPGPTAAASV
jgi:hypothetical protein